MFAPFSFLGCVRCPLCSALLFHCVSSIELKNLETQVWQMLYFSQHLPWDLSLVPEFFPLSHALVVIIITSFVLGFFCVVTVDSNNRTKRTIQNYLTERELFQTAQSLHSFVQGCRQSAQDWLSLKLWAWMVMVTRRPLTAQNDLLLSKGGPLCVQTAAKAQVTYHGVWFSYLHIQRPFLCTLEMCWYFLLMLQFGICLRLPITAVYLVHTGK